MMQGPRDRARDTQELMQRFQEAAARRRRLRLVAISGGAIVFVALVTVALAFTWPRSGQTAVAAATTTDSQSTTTSVTASVTIASPAVTAESTTTTVLATTTSLSAVSSPVSERHVVVIDPGHQAEANSEREPIGPGSSQTKAKVSSGTQSINTGRPESELVLAVALKLRESLEARGITVFMTRTTQEVNISNIERAQVANRAQADLFVRIHADGAVDQSIHGILMLYPATIGGWTDDIADESRRAAQMALSSLLVATGAKDRGMVARSDLTGFNWSDVPVILPEIGLMTNRDEDALLATDEYQDKIVQGLTAAVLEYLEVR